MCSKEIDKTNDKTLLHQIQDGNMKAFEVLFLRYYPSLCAYAKRFVEFEDGEEIVQDLMAYIWENSTMLVVESSVKNYLFMAVKNRCMTLINRNELKQRAMDVISRQLQNQTMYESPDYYVVEELTRNIEAALTRLPESYREAFEMHRFQGRTYAEIAELLHVSPKTVDYRIQQALKLLRIELKDYLPLLTLLLRVV